MHKYKDFWTVLIGNKPPGFIFGYITLAYIAAAAMIMIIASRRDVSSDRTPRVWSWRFFWTDNSMKFVLGFLLIPIFIRVEFEWLNDIAMLITSIGTGFGFMKLAQIASKWGDKSTDTVSERVTQEVNKEEVDKSKGKPIV